MKTSSLIFHREMIAFLLRTVRNIQTRSVDRTYSNFMLNLHIYTVTAKIQLLIFRHKTALKGEASQEENVEDIK